MKSSKISATSSNNPLKLPTNSVVNMPTFTAPLKGTVNSVSKGGAVTIETPRGNIKIVTDAPLRVGQNVVAALTTDKSQLHLQVLTRIASGGSVEEVTNDLPEGKADFYTFKIPGRFRGQLIEPTNSYTTSSTVGTAGATTPSTNIIDSQGIIQFISYANRGGLSDVFGRSLQTNPNLASLFPALDNLFHTLPKFLKRLQEQEIPDDELPERLALDLSNLSNISKFLSKYGWNFYLVPINDGQKLIPAKVFVSGTEEIDEKDFKSKRFQIEVDMDELGPVVIDGLLITRQKAISLNMSIKTLKPFDESLEKDIITLFEFSTSMLESQRSSLQFQKLEKNYPSKLAEVLHEYCKDKIKDFWT
jgi:hypothetical protein